LDLYWKFRRKRERASEVEMPEVSRKNDLPEAYLLRLAKVVVIFSLNERSAFA